MISTERYEEYKDSRDFDRIILLIKSGKIKCGRFANRIKIDKHFKIGKELFGNVRSGRENQGKSGEHE